MRTIVITGGMGGLGAEVVRRLSQEYRCEVPRRDALDVTDEQSVRAAFEGFGEIYGLVHLVGGFAGGRIEDTSLETLEKMLTVNLTTAFLAIREALPRLSRPGRIVAVSSIATLQPSGGATAYVVAKSALNALIQNVAAEQRGTGITVNAVLPDSMATPAMLAGGGDASKLVPLERVSETIAFLLSEGAAGVTGTLVPVR
jgi:NAD(P)-dependent dehydrogenase (short-subunit alcohol dehydrogenase family)